MHKAQIIGYFSIFFIIISVVVHTNGQLNNQVDIWHTNDFIALTRPKDTPLKKCILKKRKFHVVYCNKYYECDPQSNSNIDEVIYDEKDCGPNMNFDQNTLKCRNDYEVRCNNRL